MIVLAIDTTNLLAAVIGAVGVVLAAMLGLIAALAQRNNATSKRVERKVDGIRDGTMPEIQKAIDRLLRERAERELDHLAMRRAGDKKPSIDDPATPGKAITVDDPPPASRPPKPPPPPPREVKQ